MACAKGRRQAPQHVLRFIYGRPNVMTAKDRQRTPLDFAFTNILRILGIHGFLEVSRDQYSAAETRVYQGLDMRFNLSFGRDGTFILVSAPIGKWYQLSILLAALGASVDAAADDDLLASALEQNFESVRTAVNNPDEFD